MADEFVVLERGGDQRVGRIVEEHGPKTWTVRWPDGTLSRAESGADYMKARAGGRRHLLAADSARLPGLYDEDPVRLALVILSEQSGPIHGTELQAEIEGTIGRMLGKAEFARLLKDLPDVDGVAKSTKGWRFKGEPPVLVEVHVVDAETNAEAPAVVDESVEMGEEADSLANTDEDEMIAASSPERAHAPEPATVFPVLERKLRGDIVPTADYREWTADPRSIAELVAVAGEPAISKGRSARAFRDLLLDHLEAAEPQLDWAAAAQLLRAPAINISPKASVAVLSALAKSDVVSTVLERDAVTLAARLAELPWLDGGDESLRVRLTRQLLDDAAPEPLPRLAWKGLTADDLVRVVSGRLGAALRAQPLYDQIVVPLARLAFEEVSSRRRLFSFLSDDPIIIEAAGPERVSEAFRRVAEYDSVVAEIVDRLSARDELEAAQSEIDAVRAEVAMARERVESDAANASKLEDEVSRLRETLAVYARQQNSLTESEQRQLVVDGARIAAQVATMMATIEGENGIPGAVERAEALLARHAIETIARRGQQVPFDPTLHDAPGQRPQLGDLVNVGRPGYALIDGGETIVLVRALVAT